MATFPQLKIEVLHLFPQAIELAKAHRNDDVVGQLEQAKEGLLRGKLVVVVCGEFKQGKSSLINALLEEPGLFPVDVDITTNLVSSISYAEREKITVVLGERGHEELKPITRGEIPDYVTEQGNPHNALQARLLLIESPNERLKNGLIFVDTPGVGSLNAAHTDITYAYLPNADAVLFVTDALKPMTTEELTFIAERVRRHCRNVLYVVTKIDQKRDYEEIVASNRAKLAEVLKLPAMQVPLVVVSSRLKLAYLESREAEDLEDSHFPALEGELDRLVRGRGGQILLSRALVAIRQAVEGLKRPLVMEWRACQETSKQEMDQLEGQARELYERAQAALSESADWRIQLKDGLDDIRMHLNERLQDGFTQIRREADQLINATVAATSPATIASVLEGKIDALLTDLSRQLSTETSELQARLEEATGLGLDAVEVHALERKVEPSRQAIEVEMTGWWRKSLTVFRQAKFDVLSGASVAAAIGGIAGGAIGAFFGGVGAVPGAQIGAALGGALGGLAGFGSGVKQSLAQIREKDRAALHRRIAEVIKPFLDDSQRLCQHQFNEVLIGLQRSMRDELEGRIRQEKKSIDASLKALKEARKLSGEQAKQRVAALKAPLKQLEEFSRRVAELGQAVTAAGTAASRRAEPAAAGTAATPARRVEPADG